MEKCFGARLGVVEWRGRLGVLGAGWLSRDIHPFRAESNGTTGGDPWMGAALGPRVVVPTEASGGLWAKSTTPMSLIYSSRTS